MAIFIDEMLLSKRLDFPLTPDTFLVHNLDFISSRTEYLETKRQFYVVWYRCSLSFYPSLSFSSVIFPTFMISTNTALWVMKPKFIYFMSCSSTFPKAYQESPHEFAHTSKTDLTFSHLSQLPLWVFLFCSSSCLSLKSQNLPGPVHMSLVYTEWVLRSYKYSFKMFLSSRWFYKTFHSFLSLPIPTQYRSFIT